MRPARASVAAGRIEPASAAAVLLLPPKLVLQALVLPPLPLTTPGSGLNAAPHATERPVARSPTVSRYDPRTAAARMPRLAADLGYSARSERLTGCRGQRYNWYYTTGKRGGTFNPVRKVVAPIQTYQRRDPVTGVIVRLTRLELERFTVFSNLTLDFSPGINVLVGANGVGKTHIMKVCYAACDHKDKEGGFTDKLVDVFLPSGGLIQRLCQRGNSKTINQVKSFIGVSRGGSLRLESWFSRYLTSTRSNRQWLKEPIESVYIPVKEMLANAPGFRSLYETRAIHFEEVYKDILVRAYVPVLRGAPDLKRKRLLNILRDAIQGRVTIKNEEFFLRNTHGNIEFSLLAEGIRKLGLLWLLIRNGTLRCGSLLLWDEPETNLNPKLYGTVMEVLLELQRNGVQIVLATHDYVILKELDLRMTKEDQVAFHSLYRDSDSGEIACRTTHDYLAIEPNAIAETFDNLYDREIERGMREPS